MEVERVNVKGMYKFNFCSNGNIYFHIQSKKLKSLIGNQEGEVSDEDEAAEMPDEKVQNQENGKPKKKGKLKMCKELSDTVAICQSVSFKGFEYAKNNCKLILFLFVLSKVVIFY